MSRILFVLLIACGQQLDGDGDGFHELTNDCDDENPEISPAAIEVCDGIDNDCNGEIDELGAQGGSIFYVDLDGDGHGSENGTLEACAVPLGYSISKRDCDESNAGVHPDADEVCDGIDNDCDTHIDEYTAVDASIWFPDRDGDRFGSVDEGVLGCSAPPDYVSDGTDCDDIDPNVHPLSSESCETDYDDNCNGETNEIDAFSCQDFYADVDGDGFGGTSQCLCVATEEYLFENGGDCNDFWSTISPEALEIDDLIDNDCDGEASFLVTSSDVMLSLPYSNIGFVQLGGGDFNGDGFADILASDTHTKEVFVLYGPDIESGLLSDNNDVVIHTETGNMVNQRLLTLDANADGMDDIMLTHLYNGGSSSYIFVSPFAQELTLEDSIAQISSSNGNQQVFHADGDLNGDGFADLIISNPFANASKIGLTGINNEIGQAAVFLSPIEGEVTLEEADHFIVGEYAYDKLGKDVQTGDFNGDGIDDVVLSAISNNYSSFYGSLRFFYDVMDQEVAIPQSVISSNAYFFYIGESLGKPMDFNQDGHIDYVFTTGRLSGIGAQTMIVYGPVVDGEKNVEDYPLTVFYDPYESERPRHCVEVVENFNGDGNATLLIGDQLHEGSNGGVVYFIQDIDEGYHELDRSGVKIHSNDAVDGYMGFCRRGWGTVERSFLSPGDINGDGFDDLFISARNIDTDDSSLYSQASIIWGGTP